MRTKVSKLGKLSSILLSLIMVLNSIGITAFAAGGGGSNCSWSNETGKSGDHSKHVHLQMAAGEYQSSISSLYFTDDLTWNGSKFLYIKIAGIDEGYTLDRSEIIAYVHNSDWSGGVKASVYGDPSEAVYQLMAVDGDVTVDLKVTADDFKITSKINNGNQYWGKVKVLCDGSEIDATKAHANEEIEIDPGLVRGCRVSALVVTDSNGDPVDVTPRNGHYFFTMPADDVHIAVTAESEVYYIDNTSDHAERKVVNPRYTYVTDDMTTFTAGHYIVDGNITIDEEVHASGAVVFVLCDGSSLTLNKGINIESDGYNNSIWAYGQEEQSGTLVINGYQREGVYSNGNARFHAFGGHIFVTGNINWPAFGNTTVNILGGGALTADGELLTWRQVYNGESANAHNVAVEPCNHPPHPESVYTDITVDTHRASNCYYCMVSSHTSQAHVFDESGKCVCGQQRYHAVCSTGNADLRTYFDGQEQEWFLPGQVVTLYADVADNYIPEVTITCDGEPVQFRGTGATGDPYEFTMPEGNVDVAVVLQRVYKVTTEEYEHGTVRIMNTYGVFVEDPDDMLFMEGDKVYVEFVPDEGYTFDVSQCKYKFEPNKDFFFSNYYDSQTGYYYMIGRQSDFYIHGINFVEAPAEYKITVPASQHGTVKTDVSKAPAGSTVLIYVSPDEGYELSMLTFMKGNTVVNNLNPVAGQQVYSFVMPAYDVRVSAIYDGVQHSVTWQDEDGKYTITGGQDYFTGSEVELTIAPEDDVKIYSVSYTYILNGVPVTEEASLDNNGKITFTMPVNNAELSVEYGYSITVQQTEGGVLTVEDEYAKAGDTVNVVLSQVDPDYRCDRIEVINSDGTGFTIEDGDFVMPDGPVTVKADIRKYYSIVSTVEHATVTITDENGNEIDKAVKGDIIYATLVPDPTYHVVKTDGWFQARYFDGEYYVYPINRYEEDYVVSFNMLDHDMDVYVEDGSLVLNDVHSVSWTMDSDYSSYDDFEGNKLYYCEGETVTFTVSCPNVLKTLTATDANDNPIDITMEDGVYSFIMPATDVAVYANTGAAYFDPADDTVKFAEDLGYTLTPGESRSLGTGWYELRSDRYAGDPDEAQAGTLTINANADVNLIVFDGALLKYDRITVGQNASLTIWGQKEGSGRIIADATESDDPYAGIGFGPGVTTGSITINGGTITARGGSSTSCGGAGIGQTGSEAESYIQPTYDTSVTINYGTVTAVGGKGAAGIGSAKNTQVSDINITGGTVTATGGDTGAGIGGGYEISGNNICLSGGTVTATGNNGGAGIGSGNYPFKGETYIKINGATVTATGGDGGAGIGLGNKDSQPCTIEITDGSTVTATGGKKAAGIGSGANYGAGDSSVTKKIILSNSTVTASGGYDGNDAGAGIGGGANSCGFKVETRDGGTTIAYRGSERAEAIGHGSRSDGELDSGSLNLYPTATRMCVYVTDRDTTFDTEPAVYGEGESACRNNYGCKIVPCTHEVVIYRGSLYDDRHTGECKHCGKNYTYEPHEFEDGICVKCGAYTVSFDPNGGTGSMEDIYVYAYVQDSHIINLPACTFTPAQGMKFSGWKINGEGDLIEDEDSIRVRNRTILVAQWEPENENAYKVSWTGNISHITIDTLTNGQYVNEGCLVEFSIIPEEGWGLATPYITFTSANKQTITGRSDGRMWPRDGKYSFTMPSGDVSFSVDVSKSLSIDLVTDGPGTARVTNYGGDDITSVCAGNYIYIPVTYDAPRTRISSIRIWFGDSYVEPDISGYEDYYDIGYRPNRYSYKIPSDAAGDSITVAVYFTDTYDIRWSSPVNGTFGNRNIGRGDKWNPRKLVGDTVVFTLTPNSGYVVDKVTVTTQTGNVSIPVKALGSNKYSFVMPAASVNVDAVFTQLVTYSYDGNGGEGTMEGATVIPGTRIVLPPCSITAPAGQTFKEWQVGSATFQPGQPLTITGDTVITAVWYSTWQSVKDALAEGKDVVLLNDLNGTGEENWDIPSEIVSSLDLNGFTVNRGNTTDGCIYVRGTFTLMDTSEDGTGTLTGGRNGVMLARNSSPDPVFTFESGNITNNAESGVHMFAGTFTMNGGTITGHVDDTYTSTHINKGGYGVWAYGTFTMNGGTISGNKCGVNVYSGTTTINDGTITENTGYKGVRNVRGGGAGINFESENNIGGTLNIFGGNITNNVSYKAYGTVYGGGIFVGSNRTVNIQGNPVITGNKYGPFDSNLYLFNHSVLNVKGDMTNETPIGVTVHYKDMESFAEEVYDETPGVFTSGLAGHGTDADFVNDSGKYVTGLTADGEAMFDVPVTVSFVSGSEEITGEMEDVTVAKGSSYSLPAHGFVVPLGKAFAGWQIGDDTEDVRAADELLEVTSNVILTATWKDDVEYASIQSATVSFDEKLKLNYYIDVPEALRDGTYAVITCGEDSETIYVSESQYFDTDDVKGFKFSYTLLAQQIEDVVNIKIFDKNGDVITLKNSTGSRDYTSTGIDYTILRYVDYMIANGSKTMKVLAQAAKDYCYSAKKHFVGGECPVSEAVDAVQLGDLDAYISKRSGTMPEGVSIDSISALFESDNSFRLYLKFSGVDPKDLTFKLDGSDTSLKTSGNQSYLTFTGIVSTKLDEEHTFTISDGNSTYELTVSVLTYARAVVGQSSSDTMVSLAKSLYLYSKAADSHFKTN